MPELYLPVKNVDALHVDHGTCNLVVLHSMECPMVGGRAKSWADYLHRNPWPFFAQEYYDPLWHVQVAPLDTKCAHCGNGNVYGGHRSIGREHAGYASQPRALWTSPDGMAMLMMSARDTAADCIRWGIPPVWVDGPGLLAGKRGITSHNLCSRYLHGSTHTDPGDNFPYDLYVQMVAALVYGTAPGPVPVPEDDMLRSINHVNQDGRQQCFWLTKEGWLRTCWQFADGNWSGEAALGGGYVWSTLTEARFSGNIGLLGPGRIEIYGLSGFGNPCVIAQTQANGLWASDVYNLPAAA